jgi:hypothetical protein
MQLSSVLFRGAVLALCASSAFADVASPGYQVTEAPNFAFAAVTCEVEGGDVVTFDGSSVDRWTAAGAFVANLATYPAFVFPAFVRATPDGLAVVVGDSGSGGPGGALARVALDGSGRTPIASIVFPYDAAFLQDGRLVVSAATQGFGMGNDLELVQLAPPLVTPLGHVAGPSGPVVVARNGDLYYGALDPNVTPPPGSCEIVRWPAPLVASGGPLDDNNSIVVASGFDNASSLAFDPLKNKLYLVENDYPSAAHNIWRVKTTKANSALILSSTQFVGGLRFRAGASDATFDAFQPADGLNLVYESTDFFSFSNLDTLAPLRPVMTLSGAGTTGIGAVTLTVTGGVPNGSALLSYCSQVAIAPTEFSYPLPKFLHHSPFDLNSTVRFDFLIPADANGTSSISFWNPGGLLGLYGYQFMVGNPNGTLIGSSNAVSF